MRALKIGVLECNDDYVVFLVQMEAKKAPVSLKPGNGFMYEFPWEFMGNYKYALFLPFVYVLASGQDDSDNWCYHILMIALLRYVQVSNFLLPPSAPFFPLPLSLDVSAHPLEIKVVFLCSPTFGISCRAITTSLARPESRKRVLISFRCTFPHSFLPKLVY